MARKNRSFNKNNSFHCFNRSVGKHIMYGEEIEFESFMSLVKTAQAKFEVEVFNYCIMPTHWHFILRSQKPENISKFFHWLCMMHSKRYHYFHNVVGHGSLYANRFQAKEIDSDEYGTNSYKYVERNPVVAFLAKQPEEWKYSSCYQRLHKITKNRPKLSDPDVCLSSNVFEWLQTPQPAELMKEIENGLKKKKKKKWGDAIKGSDVL